MKVLFLISQLPYPLDTGAKIRSFNLIKQLSKKHEITIVSFGDVGKEQNKIDALRGYCGKIKLVPVRKRNIYIAAFMNLFSLLPFQLEKYHSKDMEKAIKDILSEGKYDLVHCDSVQMSLNVAKVSDIPKVLTEHNVESEILR